jgi:hypothetical protein
VAHPGQVPVRDSKDRAGAVLSVPADAWNRFTSTLKYRAIAAAESIEVRTSGSPCRAEKTEVMTLRSGLSVPR